MRREAKMKDIVASPESIPFTNKDLLTCWYNKNDFGKYFMQYV